jgi:tRNA(Arg) A34 adenosine deaminase TadA
MSSTTEHPSFENDKHFIREAKLLADYASVNKNYPFGAVLVDGNQNVICGAEDTQLVNEDMTEHAVMNLVRKVAKMKYPKEKLWECTLYTTIEPCMMCAGAIVLLGVGNVVYGCSNDRMHQLNNGYFYKGNGHKINVNGPLLEEECEFVHRIT